jgi:hypothetical protein
VAKQNSSPNVFLANLKQAMKSTMPIFAAQTNLLSMYLRFFTLLLALSASFSSAKAQDPESAPLEWCGTRGITPWLEWYRQNRFALAEERGGEDTAWLYVPTTMFITGKDNGSGYYPLEQALLSMCQMNRHFEQARIRFYLVPNDPVRYLNKTSWHEHDWDGGYELIETNRIPGRFNIFIVGDPAGNCGYSWLDAVVNGKNCSGLGNRTWAHEAGHHLSLPHPFFGWEGFQWNYANPAPLTIGNGPWGAQVEKMDGSNCYDSGDYFCDTRPDYLNFRWSCDNNSESYVLQHDPNGVPFKSDGKLIMGYSSDQCGALFTPEQIEAMRTNLRTEHAAYLQVTEPGAGVDPNTVVQLSSPIDSQTVQYNNLTLHWEPVPNAKFYAVDISLYNNANFLPRLFHQTVVNATSVTVTKGIPNNRVLFWRVRAYNEWDMCPPTATEQIGVFTTKNFSSTNDLESSLLIELSPNPVMQGQAAKLLLTADDNMDAVLTLTDASGRQCYRRSVRLSFGENLLDVPTNDFHSGIYVVTLQNEKGVIIRRLAVTN